jgi:hypothetical protein
MCPTPVGRIHSRVASLVLPAVLGVVLWLITGREDWIVLIGVLLLMGTALDVVAYTWLIRYQPPWLTGVIGLAELGFLFVLAHLLQLDLTDLEAIVFYVVSWSLATATRIALFPTFSLTYLESAGEFRRIEWSIPAPQEQLPVFASPADTGSAGPVLRSASGVHAVPLEPKPSLSGVFEVDLSAGPEGERGDTVEFADPRPQVEESPAAPAFGPVRPRPSAARRGGATAVSLAVIAATAAALIAYFADRGL